MRKPKQHNKPQNDLSGSLSIPTVTTALWGCLIARNAYAYS
jgi:hypothetical protein